MSRVDLPIKFKEIIEKYGANPKPIKEDRKKQMMMGILIDGC